MNYKFYVNFPEVYMKNTYNTLDGDTVTVESDGNHGNTKITSEKEGEVNLNLIKLSPIGDHLKYCHEISKYEDMRYDMEYGFFCIEINGQIYQSDFGNYGECPEWATHFTHLNFDQYARL